MAAAWSQLQERCFHTIATHTGEAYLPPCREVGLQEELPKLRQEYIGIVENLPPQGLDAGVKRLVAEANPNG